MQDTYYQRSEVSNSDLTELKILLYPRTQYGDKENVQIRESGGCDADRTRTGKI